MTGRPWTIAEMEAAIARGPHKSSLSPEALAHFAQEVNEKIATGSSLGGHKTQPPTTAKNFSHCGGTTQIETLQIDSGPVLLAPPHQGHRHSFGKLGDYKISSTGSG